MTGKTIPLLPELSRELSTWIGRWLNRINVSPDTLALDVIDKLGPGGTFLMQPHTMKNFKNVLYPELFQRTKAQAPGTSLEETFDDRLRARTLELMKTSPKNILPEEIIREFDLRQKKWGEM